MGLGIGGRKVAGDLDPARRFLRWTNRLERTGGREAGDSPWVSFATDWRGASVRKPDTPPCHVLGTARQVLGTARQVLGTARQVLGTARQVPGTTRQVLGTARQVLGTTRQVLGTARQVFGTTLQVPEQRCRCGTSPRNYSRQSILPTHTGFVFTRRKGRWRIDRRVPCAFTPGSRPFSCSSSQVPLPARRTRTFSRSLTERISRGGT